MAPKEKSSGKFDLPTSGEILGALVRAFQLPVPEPSLRTARRYLRGEYLNRQRISDKRKQEIWIAIGEALDQTGLFPTLSLNGELDMTVDRLVPMILSQSADKWDGLIGYLSGNSPAVDRHDLAAAASLRLPVVDLALRACAVLKLSGCDEPGEGIPLWSQDNAGQLILKHLIQSCSSASPTREDLAELVGVSDNTIDDWIDKGTRPNRRNIQALGSAFSVGMHQSPQEISAWIDRQYCFAALADELTGYVGRDAVIDCARALNRFTTRLSQGLSEYSKLTGRDADLSQVVLILSAACGGRKKIACGAACSSRHWVTGLSISCEFSGQRED